MEYSIIFGLGPAGLFVGRQLAKNNINVIGIGRYDDIGLYSKYIDGYVAETKNEILKLIHKIKSKSKGLPKAYICSDQYLTMFINECPEIFDKVEFIGVDKAIYELINDKKKIKSYCRSIGINTPKSYRYEDVLHNRYIELPLIFKLNTKEINAVKNPIGKIRIVNNFKELKNIILEIESSSISTEDIVIETYIPGNNNSQFSFGGYFKDGVELAGIIVNQLRQYPQGISSFVIETNNKDIESRIREMVMTLVKSIEYTGFLEVEFKINENEIFLMDINPRAWGWVSLLGKKFHSFHKIFDEENSMPLEKKKDLFMWKSPIRDVIGYIKNPQNVKVISFREQKKYYSKEIAFDIYEKGDIMPMFAIAKVGLIKIFRKMG